MTEETSDSVLILCQPESEIAKIIRKRLEQKGVSFCILPVGSHFAPPRIPDACGVVLLPLCRELVQIPLSDTLHQLKQAGATLLPLGREDAASLWAALTAGEEESIAQQKVYQLEDLWEERLPHSKASCSQLPSRESEPSRPAVPLASPATGSNVSMLKRWVLLSFFLSLSTLALVLWKLLSPEASHEDGRIVQTAPNAEQAEAQAPRTNDTSAQEQGNQTTLPPSREAAFTPTKGEKMGDTEEKSRGKHVCPSAAEVRTTRPGRPAYERLKEGASQGCPNCSRWLRAVNNR